MKLSVIIPTLKGEYLIQTLDHLHNSLTGFTYEIIIVNNGLRPIDFGKLDSRHIKLLQSEGNLGFTGAINKGARLAQGDYLLILNDDCLLEKNSTKLMIDFLVNNPQFVATQPMVYGIKNGVNEEVVENIGYVVDTYIGRAEVVKAELKIPKVNNKRFIYGLSATCLLIKRDIFTKIGMFDNSFHSYLEDVDLFIRLNSAGYKYYPTVNATCLHYHMATSITMGSYKQRQDFKNWIRIVLKNFSWRFITLHSPSLLFERFRNLNGLIKSVLS